MDVRNVCKIERGNDGRSNEEWRESKDKDFCMP